MKLRAVRVLPFALFLLIALPAGAQEDEEGRFSIGVGGGLVQAGGNSDPYVTANLRARIGYRMAGEERQGSVFGFVEPEIGYWTRDTVIPQGRLDTKDMLLGVNVGGAVRLRVFEYFVAGGVGYHFLDETARIGALGQDRDIGSGSVGVNAHFGFDVRMTDVLSIFGVGRYDLVQQSDDQQLARRQLGLRTEEQQTKAYLGLRLRM